MVLEVVLMVSLRWVEGLQRDNLGNDWLRINFCGIELSDVGFGDFSLLVVCVKNGRAVLRARVGSLPIELGGVVADGKENHQNLAVGNLRRIEDDFDGFGMAG